MPESASGLFLEASFSDVAKLKRTLNEQIRAHWNEHHIDWIPISANVFDIKSGGFGSDTSGTIATLLRIDI